MQKIPTKGAFRSVLNSVIFSFFNTGEILDYALETAYDA